MWLRLVLLFLVIATICLCCSCGTNRGLFGEDPTRVPCWKSLCPGQRISPEESMSILESTVGISSVVYHPSQNLVMFDWNDPTRCTKSVFCKIHGTLYYSSVALEFITLKPDYDVSIKEFTLIYGEPQCVLVVGNVGSITGIVLFFPKLGFSVDLVDSAREDERINDNARIEEAVLEELVQCNELSDSELSRIYSWQGYNAIYP
jgi:hypothetical protein